MTNTFERYGASPSLANYKGNQVCVQYLSLGYRFLEVSMSIWAIWSEDFYLTAI